MTCPAAVHDAVLEILSRGILRVRFMNDAEQRVAEADHIHNLPVLLVNYAPELLRFYWEVERAAFIDHCAGRNIDTGEFEPYWEKLRSLVDSGGPKSLAATA